MAKATTHPTCTPTNLNIRTRFSTLYANAPILLASILLNFRRRPESHLQLQVSEKLSSCPARQTFLSKRQTKSFRATSFPGQCGSPLNRYPAAGLVWQWPGTSLSCRSEPRSASRSSSLRCPDAIPPASVSRRPHSSLRNQPTGFRGRPPPRSNAQAKDNACTPKPACRPPPRPPDRGSDAVLLE